MMTQSFRTSFNCMSDAIRDCFHSPGSVFGKEISHHTKNNRNLVADILRHFFLIVCSMLLWTYSKSFLRTPRLTELIRVSA